MDIMTFFLRFLITLSLSAPLLCIAKERFPIAVLEKNWKFSFQTEDAFTYFLKSSPNVAGSFHLIKQTRPLNWQSINGETFFKQIEEQKKHIFSTIGFTQWKAKKYDWKKKNNHFELSLAGTFKDSNDKTTFFWEVHLFAPLNTLQIVITTTNPKLLAKPEVNQFVNQVIQFYGAKEPAFLTSNMKDIEVNPLTITGWNVFTEAVKSSMYFLIQTGMAYAATTPTLEEECNEPNNHLTDLCKAINEKCKSKNLPNRYRVDCNNTGASKPQERSFGLFAYMRACGSGAASSVGSLITAPFRFIGGVINKLFKPGQRRERTYTQATKLYVASTAQTACDGKDDCLTAKTLEENFPVLSHKIKTKLSDILLPEIVRNYSCFNSIGKSRSLCKFISNVAIGAMTFNAPTVISIADSMSDSEDKSQPQKSSAQTITAKNPDSTVSVTATKAAIEESGTVDDGIDESHFPLLERAEDILGTSLTPKQKEAIIKVKALPNNTRIRTHLLRKEGLSLTQIRRLKDRRVI